MRDFLDYGYNGFGYFNPFFSGYEDYLSPFAAIGTDEPMLRTDIIERANEYVLELEVPSTKRENISVDIENGYLNVSVKCGDSDEKCEDGCQKCEENCETSDRYVRRERRSGSISRSYYVGKGCDAQATAKLNGNLLVVTLPKKVDKIERTTVSVQ